MSRDLLLRLNGGHRGRFSEWLSNFQGEPRIAWYPSAGVDFRDLLYLSPQFAQINPASQPEPSHPDIFLHTDYFPWTFSTFLDRNVVHCDDRTAIHVWSIEEVSRCELPLDSQIVDFEEGSHATGRVLFFNVNVHSDRLGSFSMPVVYAFVENSAFCAKLALPHQANFSHIVHVRYGGGLGGGGKSSGIWLLNVLRRLKCECFVTDSHYFRQHGDERIYALYPELAGDEDRDQFDTIRTIRSKAWSEHGDVSWNVPRQS